MEEKARPETSTSPNLAVIVASTRKRRFADKVMRWLTDELAAQYEGTIDVVDLREIDLHKDGADFSRRIAEADAYLIVVPEYNHGYPAPLKAAIDSLGSEWFAKPVGFVSYGGTSGGIRAVEQLRQVVAELHMVSIRDGVTFHMAWQEFDDDGRPRDPERATRSLQRLLMRLDWWARALRIARAEHPYAS